MAGKRKAADTASSTPKTWKSRSLGVLKWGAVAGMVGFLLVGVTFLYLYKTIDIPNPNRDFLTETSKVYYADGETDLGEYQTQNRESIPLSEMPQSMQDAVIAAENRTFYTDSGISPRGIVRAAFSNARGGSTQGASTITQQYVKILYLTQERSLTRKAKEAILSLKVQRTQSKSQVLEGYLNTIYFGRGAYGVEAAAQTFFGKPAADLDLSESAVLASVLNNPTSLDPKNGKSARLRLKERYEFVLDGMVEMETITASERDQAVRKLPKFNKEEPDSRNGGQKGHMLTMVRKELQRLGFSEDEIDGDGLKVTTTFTPAAMKAAEEGVAEARPEGDGLGDKQLHVAVASVQPGTGAVRGFYAGQDYLKSQINWAVAGGQAGSTFKAFALAAAIDQGFSLRDSFEGNSPYSFPDGSTVENQGNVDYGSRISMIVATQKSANTAFVDMTQAMDDGPEAIIEMANKMGIPPEKATKQLGFPNSTPGLEPGATVALGSQTVSPINMANGYATLANNGVETEPYIIEKVESSSGEVLYNHKVKTQRAVSADIAADVSFALQENVRGGTATKALGLDRPAAAKTGTATAEDEAGNVRVSSAWFTGYTPQMSTAVMYVRGKGNEELEGYLPEFFGGAFPADTWLAVMGRIMDGQDVEEFPEPAYVDGEAPSSGFEPAPAPAPAPPPTRQPPKPPRNEPQQPSDTPKPTKEPEPDPEPDPDPTQPTPTQPPPPPDDGCGILGCPDPTPTQPAPTPSPAATPPPARSTDQPTTNG